MSDRPIIIDSQISRTEGRAMTPLEKTRSLAPSYLNQTRDDLYEMPLSNLKDLYFQVLDDAKTDQRIDEIADQENFLEEIINSENLDDLGLKSRMVSYILTSKEGIKNHYDPVTGLAFFDYLRNSIVSAVIKAEQAYKERPSIKVVCFDVNRLKNFNMVYGKTQANIGYHEMANKLVETANDSMAVPDVRLAGKGRVYLCRMRGTGDEVFAIFLNSDQESDRFIEIIEQDNFWPRVLLTTPSGSPVNEEFTARHIVEFQPKEFIGADTPDIGEVIKNLMTRAETKIDARGHSR